MFPAILPDASGSLLSLWGLLFVFAATVIATAKLAPMLPKDGGREFAHDGKLSAGKPRGAGIIFVLAFVAGALLFVPLSLEMVIYLVLIVICMLTGYLDDAAKTPWGEYKKGALDLCVAAGVAITFVIFNGGDIEFALFGWEISLPAWIYVILAIVLVWTSVNVTNCADGVDGLSGTLAIISILSIYVIDLLRERDESFAFLNLLLCVAILGYLWFNATPSKLMMGDAGSRAMGLFIAIAIMKTGAPFLYILVALVLMLDGGLGLIKVSLIRFCKIHVMNNIRTPLHDHVRKLWGWSNTQCVYRFAIIQIIASLLAIYGVANVL
ncbi:MAG: phospho-N-acetylmuramoyl-pentapeptide-transferase [Acetatifactor sp.]|nr:phospho-N-acetylmuramoyl-pentapeptide-transferase [Acetatifactor sp.]